MANLEVSLDLQNLNRKYLQLKLHGFQDFLYKNKFLLILFSSNNLRYTDSFLSSVTNYKTDVF